MLNEQVFLALIFHKNIITLRFATKGVSLEVVTFQLKMLKLLQVSLRITKKIREVQYH